MGPVCRSKGMMQCFNEAACNTGGTLTNPGPVYSQPSGFNEAACNTGGTLQFEPNSSIRRT